jgi:hypothetical protein
MTDNVSSIIHTKSRTGKEIKIPVVGQFPFPQGLKYD